MQNASTIDVAGPRWCPWPILSPVNRATTGRNTTRCGEIGARIQWRKSAGPVIVIPGGYLAATWRPETIDVQGAPDKSAAYQNGADSQPDPTGLPVDADLTEGAPKRGDSKTWRPVAQALGAGRLTWEPAQGEDGPGTYTLDRRWSPDLAALGERNPTGGGFTPYLTTDTPDPQATVDHIAGLRVTLDHDLAGGGRRIRLDPRQVRDLVTWCRRVEPQGPLGVQLRVTWHPETETSALELDTFDRWTGDQAAPCTRYERPDHLGRDQANRKHSTRQASVRPYVKPEQLRLALETCGTDYDVQLRLPERAGQPMVLRHDRNSGAGCAVFLGTSLDVQALR